MNHPRGFSSDHRLAATDHAPTLEEWIRAGYAAATYPPAGYAAVDSIGWQHEQERRAAEPSEIDRQFGVDLHGIPAGVEDNPFAGGSGSAIPREGLSLVPPLVDSGVAAPVTGDFPSASADLPPAEPLDPGLDEPVL